MRAPTTDAHLVAIARHGLPGGHDGRGLDRLGEAEFNALLGCAVDHNLVGLMAAAVTEGALPTTAAQVDRTRERYRTLAVHAAYVDRLLLQVLPVLEAHGRYAVSKGVAVARLDYGDPSLRLYADADVLVDGEALGGIVEDLRALGLRRVEPERREGFDRRFAKDLPMANPEGLDIDLHRTLAAGPLGQGLDVARACAAGAETMLLADTPVQALPRAARYLNACLHALRRPPLRIGDLRDLVQIDRGDLALDDLFEVAGTPALRGAVAWVTVAAADMLGGPSTRVAAWARAHLATAGRLRALRPYLQSDDRASSLALATLRGLPWRDRAPYVRALVMPGPAFLAVRRRGRATWVLEGMRRARA